MSKYFWSLYSQEFGSFRDQILWSYVIDIFEAKPIDLYKLNASKEILFEEVFTNMGYHSHTYVNDQGKLYDITMKNLM